ncbi:MAG: GTP-binding protein [Bacteroidia bacterium]|jgi:GTP-binding protein
MTVKTAKFIRSYSSIEQMDNNPVPEFAFIGRSNVGKSSLINALANHKGLAKISSKPGKTKLINQFLIDNVWHLIDLPGYGFAQVSKRDRDVFDEMITQYLLNRKELMTAFVLIDTRIEPQPIDLEFVEWCGVNGVPFQLVFTKADKVKSTALAENTELFKAALYKQGWEVLPNSFITSSMKKTGIDEVLTFISKLNKTIKNVNKKLPKNS